MPSDSALLLFVVFNLLTFISFFNPFSSLKENQGRWLRSPVV
tara:strand:- start:1902 stop:2027 length:126 start_codon:yes stop_codon:yes gene_type:complete